MFEVLFKGIKTAAKLIKPDLFNKANEVIGEIAKVAQTDPEVEKVLRDHELEMQKLFMADAKNARELIALESKSEDPFVRRVRPAFLWAGIGLMVINFCLIPILNVLLAAFGKSPVILIYPNLPTEFYTLFGAGYLGYGAYRTFDKRKKQ